GLTGPSGPKSAALAPLAYSKSCLKNLFFHQNSQIQIPITHIRVWHQFPTSKIFFKNFEKLKIKSTQKDTCFNQIF
ncbi:hypothetical protein, partial [Bacillus amyloliquefaciens]|uniref:hypothetical protein n=1 Tax=Bacillus amyloliquefaciens TaxID=1390 RepID=UPI00197AD43F